MIPSLEVGAFGPLALRRERVELGLPRPVRLLYASDLHLGHWWTARVPDHLLALARETEPHLILLGGDLVDAVRALPRLETLVRDLVAIAPVGAVPGNHDAHSGVPAVRGAVLAAGGGWLPDQPIDSPLRVEGGISSASPSRPRILCAHYPSIFPTAVDAGFNLVFAGHLHGGQCVLATVQGRLYPAIWFDRWHGLRFHDRSATLLVSRGVADTLPIRFNCPREVILCDVC